MPRRPDAAWLGWGFGCCLAVVVHAAGATAAAEVTAPPAATAAEATAPPERVRIVYSLGADCPAPDEFERQLNERLGIAWKAAPDELARTVTITATAGDGRVGVRLEYPDATGRSVSRTVEAVTCAEALAGMVVITAVAIDAQVRAPAPSASRASSTPSAPPAAVAAPAAPATRVAESRTPASKAPAEGAREPAFTHEGGVRVGLASGFGTRVAFGVGLEWGLVGRNGLAVRAALEGRDTWTVPANDGRARFRALTGRGELCVVTLSLARGLGVPLCGGLEAGVLSAEGVVTSPTVTTETSSSVLWVAAILSPRLRLTTGIVFVEVVPELRLPLVRHTFIFENPTRVAYEIPAFSLGAALTAGLRFR